MPLLKPLSNISTKSGKLYYSTNCLPEMHILCKFITYQNTRRVELVEGLIIFNEYHPLTYPHLYLHPLSK